MRWLSLPSMLWITFILGCNLVVGDTPDAYQASFRLSGRVVDQAGQPVTNIILNVNRTWWEGWEERDAVERIPVGVNGRFDLAYNDAYAVNIRPVGKGYYSDNWAFGGISENIGERVRDAHAGLVVEPMQMEVRDVEIVVHSVGEVTRLDLRYPTLQYREDGSGTVYIYNAADHPEYRKILSPARHHLPRDIDIVGRRDVEDVEAFIRETDETGLALVARHDQHGGLKRVTPELLIRGEPFTMPGEVELVAFGRGSGIQRINLSANRDRVYRRRWTLRQTMSPPEGGYEPRLMLSTDDLWAVHHSESPRAYLKLGNLYGRLLLVKDMVPLHIDRSRYGDEGGSVVEVLIRLEMQPDESRNLTTRVE